MNQTISRTPTLVLLPLVWTASFLQPVAAEAQTRIDGEITSAGQPVPLATVQIEATSVGTAADLRGRFQLELSEGGVFTLVISAVGFSTTQKRVTVETGQTVRVEIQLEESIYEAGAVVVTGTLREIGVKDSPVKVDVLPAAFLQSTPSANFMDAIERVNGLYQQIDCGVCYTNNIRINGIEGPNTAVLVDGMPIMSSLASVYGLNGISPMLIKQVEVIKGPMSTLYGSEALGGVINIITKDPATAPSLTANSFSTSHGEIAAEVAGVPMRERDNVNVLLSGSLVHVGRYHDNNGDAFSDRPLETRISLFAKTTANDNMGFERSSLVAKVYHENRNAGVWQFVNNASALRGSDQLYGESIRTRRAELFGATRLGFGVNLQFAASTHAQDSWYGTTHFDAFQSDGFLQAVWTPGQVLNGPTEHDVLVGIALRGQRYDDGTAATGLYADDGSLLANRPDKRLIPGVFVQDDWRVSNTLRLLGGYRLDVQPDYGLIGSPRLAAKWSPSPSTQIRTNAGTGFRVVNLFTEDHAAYTGGRATVVVDDLEPERSVSVAGGISHTLYGFGEPVTIDLDVFWTRFSNKIEPDYDTPGEIRYANLDGTATTRGLGIQIQGGVARGLRYTFGGTLMDVFTTVDETRDDLEFAPAFQATAGINWSFAKNMTVDYTVQVVGPMALPAFDETTRETYRRETGATLYSRSPTYAVHNLQVTRDFDLDRAWLLQAYAAVENALGYQQSSPLVGFYDGVAGFGESFDTSYVYGPIEGAHFGFGLRLTRR